MAAYQDKFNLDLTDIELIERALRNEVSRHSVRAEERPPSFVERAEAAALNRVLGKIHNQKIFYAQARHRGTPAG